MIKEYVQRTQNQLKQILMTQAGKIWAAKQKKIVLDYNPKYNYT
jgi:hypothetical protein